MQLEIWKKNILDAVEHISSREYQEKTWFGSTKTISSPEELYCELFDDYLYDDFLESHAINLTHIQRALGLQLREKLNSYLDNMGDVSAPKQVFEDPEWNEIRSSAKEFLESLLQV